MSYPMLEFLFYVSYAPDPGTDGIEKILSTSRTHNAEHQITGALCHVQGHFIQYLEGPKAALADLFERIKCDPRHSKVRLLARRPVTTRLYGSWTMALVAVDASAEPATREAIGSKQSLLDLSAHEAERLMYSLAASGAWKKIG